MGSTPKPRTQHPHPKLLNPGAECPTTWARSRGELKLRPEKVGGGKLRKIAEFVENCGRIDIRNVHVFAGGDWKNSAPRIFDLLEYFSFYNIGRCF